MNGIKLPVVILVLFAASAFAQDHYFYTESGVRRELPIQDSIIAVKLKSQLTPWNPLFGDEEALDQSVAPELLTEGFSLLRVKSGHDPVALVERLRGRPDVMFANLSFTDPLGSPIYVTETVVVNFHPSTPYALIDSINQSHSVIVLDSLFDDPYWLLLKLTEDSDLDVLTMGNQFHELTEVRFARAGMVLRLVPFADPNDPYWTHQWNFRNTGQNGGTPDADIDLDEAFEYYINASGFITVAILDDGFAAHEDFPASRFVGGYDYASGDFDFSPGEYQYHGMACLGLLGASTYNSIGIGGVALYNKVLGQKIALDNGNWTISDTQLARAFSDAVLAGARVISNSWGCNPGADCDLEFDSTTYWIRKADSAGVLVVFGAGNDGGQLRWPANLPEVIAVGGTDNKDARWAYSSYGSQLDLVAPSSYTNLLGDIWTLDQMDGQGINPFYVTCTPQDMSYVCRFGGTSAACPQAAGVAALVLQRRPDLVGNTATLKNILRYSSDRTPFGRPPSDTARVDNFVGWGRLNAARALLAVVRGDADNNGNVGISDAVYMVNYIFYGGPLPVPNPLTGDADCSGALSISDSVYLINYIFAGGPAPGICYNY